MRRGGIRRPVRRAERSPRLPALDGVLRSGQNIVVMSERPPGSRKRKAASAREAAPHVPAAEFKATCLELMDKVNRTGAEYVITKHGKPVAKLVPVETSKKQGILGSMRGSVLKYERPFDPVPGEWDINK